MCIANMQSGWKRSPDQYDNCGNREQVAAEFVGIVGHRSRVDQLSGIYDKLGATTATYFQSDFSIYIPTGVPSGNYHTLEYDIFQYFSPYDFMWGSQSWMGG